MDPAVSPDGRLLAYASDRADGRNLNIWIQRLGEGGSAAQLTHFDTDTSEPSFSPDTSKIVFRSRENGGGIYVISTIGGDPTRLAPGGRNPRFSPDGQWIAYWIGIQNSAIVTGGEGGEIYIVPASGGQPRHLGQGGIPSGVPMVSVYLYFVQILLTSYALGAVIPTNGEPSRRTDMFNFLKRQGFSIGCNRIPRISQWTTGSNLFSAINDDAFNAWRMPVSDDGRSLGPAERLTSGTTLETSPWLTPTGSLIFASLDLVQSVWSLPLDADRAKITGELKEITGGPAESEPSVSMDGRKLAFAVNRNTRPNSAAAFFEEPSTFQLRVKNLSTGKEALISDAEHRQPSPQDFALRNSTRVHYAQSNSDLQNRRLATGHDPRNRGRWRSLGLVGG
jgi:hypothetical protein